MLAEFTDGSHSAGHEYPWSFITPSVCYNPFDACRRTIEDEVLCRYRISTTPMQHGQEDICIVRDPQIWQIRLWTHRWPLHSARWHAVIQINHLCRLDGVGQWQHRLAMRTFFNLCCAGQMQDATKTLRLSRCHHPQPPWLCLVQRVVIGQRLPGQARTKIKDA